MSWPHNGDTRRAASADGQVEAALGRVVRARRTALGLSARQFGALQGRSQAWVSHVECGRQNVSMSHLWALASALRMRPSGLVRAVQRELERAS